MLWSVPITLHAMTEKLKRQSKDDFKGRHFEALVIVQAVTWYLRYPLSYQDLEEMFKEHGFEGDHNTINRWVLSSALMIEKRLLQFRRPHCGSVRIDETYVRICGKWRYLYRAIDKHGNPVNFMLSARRLFRNTLKDQPFLPSLTGVASLQSAAFVRLQYNGQVSHIPPHCGLIHHGMV